MREDPRMPDMRLGMFMALSVVAGILLWPIVLARWLVGGSDDDDT